jgi:hypothetical protein
MSITADLSAGVYRARSIKRARRTRAAVDQLDDQIVAVLAEDYPQSVRHVFYRMTDPRLAEPVEKSDRGYRHVQDRVVKLRRSGRVPYGWITDATRRGYHVSTFADLADFIRRTEGFYRADLWRTASYYCEVWVESRSIAGTIQHVCEELAVSLYPTGGFSSISLAYEAAEQIKRASDGRPVVILYIGDYDPAGVLIDVALERELRAHLPQDITIYFHRLGITKEQIARYDLPSKPRKEGDRRSPQVEGTVEAEAMPANVLRQLLRDHVEQLLPPQALRVAKVNEESQRAGLLALAGALEAKR